MSRPTKPYVVPAAPVPTDLALASNEGRPPRGLPAFDQLLDLECLCRYPNVDELRARLASRCGVGPQQLIVTCGGDDALQRICLATLSAGREALVPSPTFEMIPFHVALADGGLREVAWPSGPFPTDRVLGEVSERTALISVVSPNNPTGAVATAEDLERVSRGAGDALVLLDHAYVELADEDLTALALSLGNVVILRTLSKAWGLAGLRVGYTLGPARWIERLAAAGNPYSVSSVSAAIAMARLTSGERDMREYVDRVRLERSLLAARLSELGVRPQASQANFVLVRMANPLGLRDALAQLGIAVRIFPDRADLGDAVRITCPGDGSAFERLLEALNVALESEELSS